MRAIRPYRDQRTMVNILYSFWVLWWISCASRAAAILVPALRFYLSFLVTTLYKQKYIF